MYNRFEILLSPEACYYLTAANNKIPHMFEYLVLRYSVEFEYRIMYSHTHGSRSNLYE